MKAVWCQRAMFPIWYAFVPDRKAWKREMRRLDVKPAMDYPESDGSCTTLENSGKVCSLVTIADHLDKKIKTDPCAVASLITHEAVHVWQAAMKSIGEGQASSELEAYGIQTISQELMEAYAQTRLKGKKK